MDPIQVIEGKVAVLDRADVDTDQIIPKQFLKRIERTGFGEFLFYDWFKSGEIELEPQLRRQAGPRWPQPPGEPADGSGRGDRGPLCRHT